MKIRVLENTRARAGMRLGWLSGARRRSGVALLASLLLTVPAVDGAVEATRSQADLATLGATATAFRLADESAANNVKVTWTTTPGAERYDVSRAGGDVGAPELVGSVHGDTLDDYSLAVGTTYEYTVRAVDASGAVLGESVAATAATYAPPAGLESYDNTRPSSLQLREDLEANGVYYRYEFAYDDQGLARVVEKTSPDGYTFSGDDVVLDRSTDPSLQSAKLESVKVVKHPGSGDFVLVAHYENADDYSLAHLFIAVATPGDDFAVRYNERPLGHDSRDITFFADGDTAYVLSATNTNQDLNVYRLTADWTGVEELTSTLFTGQRREAPAMVKVGGTYYLFSSEAAGWYPSQPKYASASSVDGPWTELREIGNTATYGAQSGGIVRIGQSYAMMANRWGANWKHPEPTNSQRMLPISFNAGWASYDFFETVDYDDERGIVTPVQHGRIVSVDKPVSASSLSTDAPGEDVTFAASKANDGLDSNVDNYFKSGATPFTWEVDLRGAFRLDRVNLTTKLVNGSETAYDYAVEGSLDHKTYVSLGDASGNTSVGFTTHEITTDSPIRYVRVSVDSVTNVQNGNGAAWARGFSEVTVYGTPTDTPAPDTVATPTADVTAGTYYEPKVVTLQSATPGASIYVTTDGSTPSTQQGTLYTAPVEISETTTLKAVAVKDGLVDSAVLSVDYVIGSAGSPVSLAEPIYAATYVGGIPDLPERVLVTTATGATREADVSWDLSDLIFDQHYRTFAVAGSVEGVLTVTAWVETVPESILYYVDSGMAAIESPSYEGVQSLVSDRLRNAKADQPFSGTGWGYDASQVGGTRGGTATDKDETGLWAAGNGASSRRIAYQLPLDGPGTYTLTAGFREWWAGPRQMRVEVLPAAGCGDASVITENVTVSLEPGADNRSRMVSGTFTTMAACSVEARVSLAGGSEAPVVGWLAVAAGAVDVDTTPLVVAAPVSDPPAGTYGSARTVSLTSATAGAAIYYTTDGSAPSKANGTRYDEPFIVDQTTTVRSVAIRNGTSSTVTSAAYRIEPVPTDGYDSVPVGRTWYDTDGNPLQAHGGGFLEKDGWYYWVGENKSHNSALFRAVSLYRSQDLKNWEFVKDILTQETAGVCAAGTYDGESCKVERPKLVYNEASDTYVLWGHWENAESYAASHLIVATSPTIDGDYAVVRNFRPGVGEVATDESDPTYGGSDGKWGYGSRDFTVFKDPDSSDAYLVSAQDHLSMRVYKLTGDYTDVDWENSYPLFEDQRREAPALVKVGDHFAVVTSSQSGWYPNQAMYSVTSDISDPDGWSDLGPVGNNTTFYSQPTNIMTIDGEDGQRQYIYMGDRWNPNALGSSTYVWLPIEIGGANSTELTMSFHPGWGFDADTGTVEVPTDELVSQGRPVTATQLDPGYPPSAANDGVAYNLNSSGDNTNYYLPPGMPFSWAVDLEESRDLSRVDLSFRSYNGSETYSEYTVWGSDDGQTWERLVSRLDNTTVGFTSDPLVGTYRHVRVDVAKVVNDHNGNEAAWAAGLVEVQVYARAARAPGVDLDVIAEARCLAGRAAVAVRATNTDGGPVDVRISTPWGAKDFTAVGEGRVAYQTFLSRTPAIGGGVATVAGTASDGRTEEYQVPYGPIACG